MYRCKACKAMLTEESIGEERTCPFCGGEDFIEVDGDLEYEEE